MSSDIYTLPELVDLALKTPEGAVNFNTLRIVLLKIISESNLQNITTEYKPPERKTLVTDVLEEKEVTPQESTQEALRSPARDEGEKQTSGNPQKAEPSEEKEHETPKKWDPSPAEGSDRTETPRTPRTPEKESATGEQKSEDEKEYKKVKLPVSEASSPEPSSGSTTSKSGKAGTNLWQLWQIKKMMKKIEAFEEQLSSLIDTVDELEEFKESRLKRILFEEGEKFQSGYSGTLISRQEFEDTVHELGEALARTVGRLREQQDNCKTLNQDVLKEMRLKVSIDDLEQHKEDLSRKIGILCLAVKKMQTVIQDSLNPESCAVTKCVACKRKAHLPNRFTEMGKRDFRMKNDSDNAFSSDNSPRMRAEKEEDLPFTRAALKRYEKEENMDIQEDMKSSLDKIPVKLEKYTERTDRPEYFKNVEAFDDIDAMARDFLAMKERKVFIPKDRPKQPPTTIPLDKEETDNIMKRYPKI